MNLVRFCSTQNEERACREADHIARRVSTLTWNRTADGRLIRAAIREYNPKWLSPISNGVHAAAKSLGCRRWWRRSKGSPNRMSAPNPAIPTFWLPPRSIWRIRSVFPIFTDRTSACETKFRRSNQIEFGLSARDLKPRSPALLGAAQPGLAARDIVPRHRHDALPFRDLDLEVHQVLLSERHL